MRVALTLLALVSVPHGPAARRSAEAEGAAAPIEYTHATCMRGAACVVANACVERDGVFVAHAFPEIAEPFRIRDGLAAPLSADLGVLATGRHNAAAVFALVRMFSVWDADGQAVDHAAIGGGDAVFGLITRAATAPRCYRRLLWVRDTHDPVLLRNAHEPAMLRILRAHMLGAANIGALPRRNSLALTDERAARLARAIESRSADLPPLLLAVASARRIHASGWLRGLAYILREDAVVLTPHVSAYLDVAAARRRGVLRRPLAAGG